MRDIKIKFNRGSDTRLVLNEAVEGKSLFQQKYLINTVTSKNSDPIFPERGTDLLKILISGAIVDAEQAIHTGNFASTDTEYFCTYEEHSDAYESTSYVDSYALEPVDYDNDRRVLTFQALFNFKDGTQTDETYNVTDSN